PGDPRHLHSLPTRRSSDLRCMIEGAKHFRKWRVPFWRSDRGEDYPLVWMGGQGLHNPLPMADVADLIVIGDAEDPLPILLELWRSEEHTSELQSRENLV